MIELNEPPRSLQTHKKHTRLNSLAEPPLLQPAYTNQPTYAITFHTTPPRYHSPTIYTTTKTQDIVTMPRKTLRILCFGDSLTSGYFCHGMDSHPYALKLEDRLTGTFPEVDFEIVLNAVPGDVASFKRFKDRMDAACM